MFLGSFSWYVICTPLPFFILHHLPREIEISEQSGSIQELHEQSENILEYYEAIVHETEEEIERMKSEIEARRDKPNPYPDLNSAQVRIQDLYFAQKRTERWRYR